MPSSNPPRSPTTPRPTPALKPAERPASRFFVRCTFVGEEKKRRIDGSFRFVAEAADANALFPKLEKAVRKLRRTGELPPRCDVYVEFVLELAGLDRGVIADFERWEHNPKRFQRGCITFSDACAVYQSGQTEASFRFGAPVASAHPAAPGAGG
ncbi:MAG TPA: hypothetical protein VHE61_24015 [Opitutaceae bacterium]|nr:hypothetical protein [Opitutaceae bacterium]